MSNRMARVENVVFRYGYCESEAIETIKNARILSATGLNNLDVAMEMLYRLGNPGQMKWDTREDGWHPV